LPLATLFQHQTIEELAIVLDRSESITHWSSLVQIRPAKGQLPAKSPLFCIHPIGGNVLEYYDLANYLDPARPIYGLQSQGLDGQQALTSVEDMANHYIKEIRTIQPNGPYSIAGYSFGGLIAFEMAQQLVANGEEMELLALLDCNVPNLPKLRPSFLRSSCIHLSNIWQLEYQEKFSYVVDRIAYRFRHSNDRDFLLQSLYKSEDITPQIRTILDANLQAGENYTARPYPGKITLFRCEIQDIEHYLYPDFGWKSLIGENLDIHSIPGPHFRMLKEPRVNVLAEFFNLCLQQLG
jgi:thioesterase domain-containing protein